MATKSPKSKKTKKSNNNNILIGGIVAVVAAILIIVVAIFTISANKPLDDSYFVSDDTKYVMSLDAEDIYLDPEEEQYVPEKAHMIYYYSGDNITGVKAYYKYANEETAKSAFDYFNSEATKEDNDIKELSLNGKYLILVANEEQYKDITASEVKEYLDFIEESKNINSTDSSEEYNLPTEVVE